MAEGRYNKVGLACPEAAPHSLGRRLASEEMSMLSNGPIENLDGTRCLHEVQDHCQTKEYQVRIHQKVLEWQMHQQQ